MLKYGLIACFSPTLVNLSLMGTVRQKLGVGKWKKIGVLAIQKVAKTGNIPVVGDMDYVRYLIMQKVNFPNNSLFCVF